MKKNIKDVKIGPGCISCGACETDCPEVFKVNGLAQVKDGVDLKHHGDAVRRVCEVLVQLK